jgi:catechol 2,3-dioxygenase
MTDIACNPRRLTHVNLFVENMERSMDFYKDVVGLGESYRRIKSRGGFLTNGNTHHDIGVMEYSERLGGKNAKRFIGFYHVAFEMENDWALRHWYVRAVDAKANFFFLGDHGNTHSIYLFDPDGNQIEVYSDTLKEWWKLKTGYMPTTGSQWRPDSGEPSTERNYHENPTIAFPPHGIFHPRRTTRATIVLRNYSAGVAFYRDLVGLTPVAGGEDMAFTAFAGTTGAICLMLWRASPTRPPGYHHVSLEVGDRADLLASKTRLVDETGRAVVQTLDHNGRLAVYIEDLDGFLIQLYADDNADIDWNTLDPDIAFLLG